MSQLERMSIVLAPYLKMISLRALITATKWLLLAHLLCLLFSRARLCVAVTGMNCQYAEEMSVRVCLCETASQQRQVPSFGCRGERARVDYMDPRVGRLHLPRMHVP